jgi:hypothetical protein
LTLSHSDYFSPMRWILNGTAGLGILLVSAVVGGCSTTRRTPYTAPTFDLEILGAAYTDTVHQNSVVVVFGVTPKSMKDFAPILSMGISYSVNAQSMPTRVDIMNQAPKQVRLVIHGENMPTKAPDLYALTGNRIDIALYEEVQFLVFYFDSISEKPITEMVIKYGLWEKNYPRIRVERDFQVPLHFH